MTLPVIVSERNNPRRQAAHPLWAQILAKLYPRADAIVMQTRDSLECLPPSARARAHVIPNPVSAPATAAPGDRPTVIAGVGRLIPQKGFDRSEAHTSELQSLLRISYAVFCLKKKKNTQT